MTVRLLTPRGNLPINALFTSDAATEAALVAEGIASTNLAGGIDLQPAPTALSSGNYTIGSYYFPGWSTPGGGPNPANPWAVIPANRMPLSGAFDETRQDWCDYNLELMRNAGLRFVAPFHYYQGSAANPQPFLDHWVKRYATSRVPDKPKLCLAVEVMTNAATFSFANWPAIAATWMPYISDTDNYLRFNGRPVVMVFDAPSFQSAMGSQANVVTALGQARALYRGFGGLHFMAINSNGANFWMNAVNASGWDGVTAYTTFFKWEVGGDTSGSSLSGFARIDDACYGANEVIATRNSHSWWGNAGYVNSLPGQHLPFPAPALQTNGWANTAIPSLWAPIQTGWDSRPWDAANTLIGIPTDAEFEAHCIRARQAIDAYRAKTAGFGIVTAWNEFGEGQWVQPGVSNGYGRLNILRRVFC